MPRVVIELIAAVAIFIAGLVFTGHFGIETTWACNDRTHIAMFPQLPPFHPEDDQ